LITVAMWAEVGTKYNENRHAGRLSDITPQKQAGERAGDE